MRVSTARALNQVFRGDVFPTHDSLDPVTTLEPMTAKEEQQAARREKRREIERLNALIRYVAEHGGPIP